MVYATHTQGGHQFIKNSAEVILFRLVFYFLRSEWFARFYIFLFLFQLFYKPLFVLYAFFEVLALVFLFLLQI